LLVAIATILVLMIKAIIMGVGGKWGEGKCGYTGNNNSGFKTYFRLHKGLHMM